MKLPVRIEDGVFLVDAEHELICHLDASTASERAAIIGALNLLPVARDLIAEAMDNHIYNEADGEKPDKDCQYAAFLRDADEVLKEIKNA